MATLGAGTKQATTTNSSARLLDLTRLVSRAGRTLTGVDRVERAYLSAFLAAQTPCYGLVRTRFGYMLLGQEGMQVLVEATQNGRVAANILTQLRACALGRAPKQWLSFMLRRRLPAGVSYVNTGHTNLTSRVIKAIRSIPQSRIAVLLHDTIPLDYPEYQAEGATDRFAGFLARACAHADTFIYNSHQTEQDVGRHATGPLPQGIVAHLGIDAPLPVPADLPADLDLDRPYFITVGTIEPRKDHALLLDVWQRIEQEMGEKAPLLLICGARGWRNKEVFDRLDSWPSNGALRELPSLSDGAIAALTAKACGALFPSRAEGYGLPPAEAALQNTPIVCGDLPIYREFLGNIPVYAPLGDAKLWYRDVIMLYTAHCTGEGFRERNTTVWQAPDWHTHFERVMPWI